MSLNFPLMFALLATVIGTNGQDILERSQQLSDRVSVSWTVNFVEESATFLLTAETHGFIGFGLSPQGGMNHADVIIGGVLDNGEPYFTDRFATGKMEPKIDDHQDWFLIEASENATHTVLRFNRTLNTCDPEDLPMTNDTTKFIWSLGATDQIVYHEQRGASSVLLLDPSPPAVDTSVFDKWDIVVNTTMPTADTSYWCTVHKTPSYTAKRHMVGFEVDLEAAESKEHTHHLVLHKCLAQPGSEVGSILENLVGHPGGDCYEQDGVGMANLMNYCSTYLYVWAKGGDPLFLPQNIGFPMNEEGLQEYFMLEIHYDNPKVLAGVTYKTGVQIFNTPELREEDAGVLYIGHSSNIALIVPPESDSYVVAGHCSSRCTGTTIPPEGLNVFNVLLHAHLSGRQIKARHYRPGPDGQFVELPWIFDNNYDFNYQQNRPLKEYMKIYPNDHFTHECTYNSTWRSPPSSTFGGLSTRHEMCDLFLMYYPRLTTLDLCASQVNLDPILPKFGIQQWDETSDFTDPTVLLPAELAGKNFSTVLDTMVDWSPEFRNELQTMSRYNDQYELCYSYSNTTTTPPLMRQLVRDDVYFTNYPQVTQEYVPPDQCAH